MERGIQEKRDFKNKSKTKRKCFISSKEGHPKHDFPEKKRKRRDKDLNSVEATVAGDGYEGVDVFSITTGITAKDWILDSGCSVHMSPNRQWFSSFTEIDTEKVLMGNNAALQVNGIGTIKIRTSDGVERTLTDVRYVPEVRRNLISLGIFEAAGCSFTAQNGVLKVTKGGLTLIKGTRLTNNLYILQGTTISDVTVVASTASNLLPQGALPETSATSSYSTTQVKHENVGDDQEEVYQKIKRMRELYLPELIEMYQKIATKLQEIDFLPQQKPENYDKIKIFKTLLERVILFLQIPKRSILPGYKDNLDKYESQIIKFVNTNRPRKPVSQPQQGQALSSHMHTMQQPHSQITHAYAQIARAQSQIFEAQSHENQKNPQLQTRSR